MAKRRARYMTDEQIKQSLDDAWLGLEVDEELIYNPLARFPEMVEEKPELYVTWLMSRPEYLSFFCSEILNFHILPYQALILREMWNRKFPMLIASRGASKTSILALYSLLRAIFLPGRKIVIAGSGFRQSKIVFNYIENHFNNSPILRDIIMNASNKNGPTHETDMHKFVINESTISAIPVGTGEKIRGMRANDIIVDEFSVGNPEIFEVVISGFGAVSSQPLENVKKVAAKKKALELGVKHLLPVEDDSIKDNQIIISGTAYYAFNHFCKYWKRWHDIIESRGDPQKLENIGITEDDIKNGFNWSNYSIIRLPIELIPEGFMDMAQVARSKTSGKNTHDMEYKCCFLDDSDGFFKRGLIEKCVVNHKNPIILHESGEVVFSARLKGNRDCRYVMGIDPAIGSSTSEMSGDNFAIVILEIHPDHRRIVYCWTINKKQHKKKVAEKICEETDYYEYCTKKIRSLLKVFPCDRIAIDTQGGGVAIMEGLQRIVPGQERIFPIIDIKHPRHTDGEAGLHIIEPIQFANTDWIGEANHGMRNDFESRILLFPFFDTAELAVAAEYDSNEGRKYDTLEDCVMEIEELKDELALIEMKQTPSGRDKWDTPEYKISGNKKGKMRKDRYSALLIANGVARKMAAYKPIQLMETSGGGWASKVQEDSTGIKYIGPSWLVTGLGNIYEAY